MEEFQSIYGDCSPDKLIRWKNKLLDLTLSSGLVNLRVVGVSPKAGFLLSDDLYHFYDMAKTGNMMIFSSCPAEYRCPVYLDSEDHVPAPDLSDMATGAESCKSVIQNALKQNIVYMGYEKDVAEELLNRFIKADKEYRSQFGTGILYLSFGVVGWIDEKIGKRYYAPVLLLPVVCAKSGEQYRAVYEGTEIFLNAAVTELLKIRFGLTIQGLFPMPMGEDDKPDLRQILVNLRLICKNCRSVEVFNYASIGIFQFSQYLLWNDLDKYAEVFRNHPVIRSMIENIPLVSDNLSAEELEKQENELFLPMSADQSQIEAVRQALKGQSFVLHGPPGTGKSQTITMMLANYIGNGKAVLFSAEKNSAWRVVYERLSALGLKDFCMPLNTDDGKANTAGNFLSHYEYLMELTAGEYSNYKDVSNAVETQKAELEEMLSVFEQKTEGGKRLLDLLAYMTRHNNARKPVRVKGSGRVASLSKTDLIPGRSLTGNKAAGYTGAETPSVDEMKKLLQGDYREKLQLLKDTAYIGTLLGDPEQFPLAGWTGLQYRYGLVDSIRNLTEEYLIWLDDLECIFENICLMAEAQEEELLHKERKNDENKYRELTPKVVFDQLIHISEIPEEVCRFPNFYVKLLTWQKYLDIKDAVQILNRLTNPGFLELNLEERQTRWERIRHKVDTGSKIARMDMKADVRRYMKNPSFTERDYDDALAAGILVKNSGLPTKLSFSFSLDKEETIRVLKVVEKYFSKGILIPLIPGQKELLMEYSQILKEYYSFTEKMSRDLNCRIPFWNGETEFEIARQEAERWSKACEQLREWCHYSELKNICLQKGLGSWIAKIEAGEKIETVCSEIEKTCNAYLADKIFKENHRISDFAGYRYEILAENLDKLMQEYFEACAKEIRCRQIHRIRRALADPANAEQIILLKKMIVSRGKGLSIRSVIENVGHLLVQMTPCMIASPMQAAQCIPLNEIYFDHMVLDEASQLQTARAVGLIVRSHHSIVVGDPHQMPPTDFFGTSYTDEEADFKEADQESILMDFIALNMPDFYLKWHYRSHHESLIEFSNKNYYDGKIITFPSVDAFQSRVNTVFCNGIYDRGAGMTNRIEAEKLVDYMVSQLSKSDRRSYGVITFNSRQQVLIQRLIEKRCDENERFSEALLSMEERGESVFVRNLESVQGDERDVILFSIGYGPDQEGKILMNFGPLARQGGYRRLNVAVTRAKDEMILFTSLKSHDMKLNEMTPRGVKDLKKFLEYAENGSMEPINKHGKRISENQEQQSELPEDGFRKTVCEFLSDHHIPYGVGIGQSDLRIDIAVYSEKKQCYVLGIILNSKAIGGRFSIYDSEVGMMKKLSADRWKIIRMWTIDWIENPEKEKKRLLHMIEQVMREG